MDLQWSSLASHSSENWFQDCCCHFHGVACTSRCTSGTNASTILRSSSSLSVTTGWPISWNLNCKIEIFLFCCIKFLEWITTSSFIQSSFNCCQKRTTVHHQFLNSSIINIQTHQLINPVTLQHLVPSHYTWCYAITPPRAITPPAKLEQVRNITPLNKKALPLFSWAPRIIRKDLSRIE